MARISFEVDGRDLVAAAEVIGSLSTSEINEVLVGPMVDAGVDYVGVLQDAYDAEAGAVAPDYTGSIRSSIGWRIERGDDDEQVATLTVGLVNDVPSHAQAYLSGSHGASVGQAQGPKPGPEGTPYQKLAAWLLSKKGADVEAQTDYSRQGKGRRKKDGSWARRPARLSRSKQFGSSLYWRVRKILEHGIRPHPFVDKAVEDPRWDDITDRLRSDGVRALQDAFERMMEAVSIPSPREFTGHGAAAGVAEAMRQARAGGPGLPSLEAMELEAATRARKAKTAELRRATRRQRYGRD